MFKNVATKVALFAFDTTSGAAKTGDSGNITAYVSKDYGSVTQLADTSATEMDATNAKGWYLFDVAQGETNADALLFTGKSGTSNIAVVGAMVFTTPASFTSFVTPTGATVAAVTGLTASDVGAIKAKTDNLPSDPADASDIATAFAAVPAAVAGVTITGSYTLAQLMKLLAAVAVGKTTITDLGGGGATVVFRNVPDNADAVSATMADSARTAVTLNPA